MYRIIADAGRSEDWDMEFQLNDVDRVSGVKAPRSLSGASVRLPLRLHAADVSPAVEASTANGRFVAGSDGSLSMSIPASAVSGLVIGQSVSGDCVLTNQDGSVGALFRLTVNVTH